jgi:hypothetical protein
MILRKEIQKNYLLAIAITCTGLSVCTGGLACFVLPVKTVLCDWQL